MANSLVRINVGDIREGLHTSPKGRSGVICVTRPITKARLENAIMQLDHEEEDAIWVRFDHESFRLGSYQVIPALRSLTSIQRMDIWGDRDYLIVSEYPAFRKVARLSGWRGPIDWDSLRSEARERMTHLAIARRFNPYSPNFHLIAYYSDEPFVPFDFLKRVQVDSKEEAQIFCLYFNSIFFLVQWFMRREETSVRFPDLREDDLELMHILSPEAIDQERREELVALFDSIKNLRFPSLMEQLQNPPSVRLDLDRTILRTLGLLPSRVDEMLPRIYTALATEFKVARGLRKETFKQY